MIRINILTADTAWAERYNLDRTTDGMVTVKVDTYEEVRFAGQPMIRFDLKAITRTLPNDCMNRHQLIPAARIVQN